MINLFDKPKVDLKNITCHSGGAEGADSFFEKIGLEYGVKTRAYSYKTKYHNSINKVEISEEDFVEGLEKVLFANKTLNRYGIHKFKNLLSRNWCQVKYSKQVIAVGSILNPGEKSSKGYRCLSKHQSVDGGTGYACQMSIDSLKPLFVFDQIKEKWFRWSFTTESFLQVDCPYIQEQDFAGIGTRGINETGILAIREVYGKTFS